MGGFAAGSGTMAGLLSNFRNTMILSTVLAVLMLIAYTQSPHGIDSVYFQAVFRWMHVVFGVLWIGLLYYFNFVQIRMMPNIPADQNCRTPRQRLRRESVHVRPGGRLWRR
jgi:uncharacterized membrane protein